jgi:rhamnosyl/mannosyltransferase
VIFAARLATISSAPVSLAMFALLRREQPDIVHLQFPYPWGEVANYFFGRGRKTVMTYQSDIVRQKYLRVVYAPLMQRVLSRVDAIVATSPNYIASSPVLARWNHKCVAIPMGIDPRPFNEVDPRAGREIRARLGVTPSVPLLLFVGALRYYKGLNYLLEALPTIPRAHVVIVGKGPMEREWKNLAHELGIGARVTFVGEVANSEAPPYYAACDVFVLPSSERSEAFGLVQLEAMAAGKPVVCTELGTGTSFVNADGATGYVVPARDPHALASAITRLIEDDALRARMGAAGRARVQRHFQLNVMVDRVMALYNTFDVK